MNTVSLVIFPRQTGWPTLLSELGGFAQSQRLVLSTWQSEHHCEPSDDPRSTMILEARLMESLVSLVYPFRLTSRPIYRPVLASAAVPCGRLVPMAFSLLLQVRTCQNMGLAVPQHLENRSQKVLHPVYCPKHRQSYNIPRF